MGSTGIYLYRLNPATTNNCILNPRNSIAHRHLSLFLSLSLSLVNCRFGAMIRGYHRGYISVEWPNDVQIAHMIYLTIKWGIAVCMCVCVSVCVSVCLSGYTFPHFSTDLLQIWREPSTGHDTFRGLYIVCVHARRARARAVRTYWPRAHVTWHQLSPAVHLSSLCTEQSCLPQTVKRILSKFAGNVLLLIISVNDNVLFMFTHRARACVRAKRAYVCIRLFLNGLCPNLLGTYYD
jgi:hypothetical protein